MVSKINVDSDEGKKMTAAAVLEGGFGVSEQPNIVDRAVDACGGSMTILAERLERVSGMKCTKQKIWNWRERGQIPADWALHVHSVTRIPLKELLTRTRPRSAPAE